MGFDGKMVLASSFVDGLVRFYSWRKDPQSQLWVLEQAPALSFNCESLLCCHVLSAFSCFPLLPAFLHSSLFPFYSKLPLCLFSSAFLIKEEKRLNKSEGSLCIIGECKCLIQLNVERVRLKLKEIIFYSCLTHRASSMVNNWPQKGYLSRGNNRTKPHNHYLLNYLYLYGLILCVLIMGLSKPTAHRILYNVTFEYFSSASQGGKGYRDVVQVTQDQRGLLYNRWWKRW